LRKLGRLDLGALFLHCIYCIVSDLKEFGLGL